LVSLGIEVREGDDHRIGRLAAARTVGNETIDVNLADPARSGLQLSKVVI